MDASGKFFFFFLAFLATAETQELCSAREIVQVAENNAVGDLVETLILEEGVTASLVDSNVPFILEGNRLLASQVLDFETSQSHVVKVSCSKNDPNITPLIRIILVFVLNVNDNAPVFEKSTYHIDINELLKVGTVIGAFPATDRDADTTLYYTLTSESNYLRLESDENPELVIQNILDYDKVQSVQLVLRAQDTPLSGSAGDVSFTATTTIEARVVDVDNRPPWFQPCDRYEVAGAVICQSNGYTSQVYLNEMQAEPLTLNPGPLYAIDGDVGINEAIVYSFLGETEEGLFEINANTGDISIKRAVDVLGNISLTVLAAQTPTSSQFTTTTLTVSVQVKTLHKPKFERESYQGVVSSVGAMATDPNNNDEPLQIVALDEDYASMEGKNPHIVYRIIGSDDFSIIQGYLFMTKDLPEDTLSLQVEAVDTSNREKAVATLSVEVKTEEVPIPPGGFGPEDMAALGATLGILLFACVVVIGVLVCRLQRGKADWKKIHEASIFRSSLGQDLGGEKQGVQYTNEAFQHDNDDGSVGSGSPYVMNAEEGPTDNSVFKSSVATLSTLLEGDNISQESSDKEKEVKPILTKERRLEEGYKAVWFKEDIDPDAKEEVVIIPDSREDDSGDEDDEGPAKPSKVGFTESDMDSGLGVKIEDPAEDSDGGNDLNVNL
ncbi:cadherin-related family member 5 isoform X2 [Corythoichthys intestinalis]|uniref:cadherin-related family member 5 isoform X2 n=1 Tax=Corythoichthys intestinalis TaxID=161448 RepID=UPI0025A63FB7|nr:cadherin-related family member 5 isoform X2 [Corythoichthys intestinalis]